MQDTHLALGKVMWAYRMRCGNGEQQEAHDDQELGPERLSLTMKIRE